MPLGVPQQCGAETIFQMRAILRRHDEVELLDHHLHAVVTRQVFLGSARDYTVALDDKTELRVTAPPGRNIAPGERVWLHLPAEQVRALAEE